MYLSNTITFNGAALQVSEIEYWEHCLPEDIIKALYWSKVGLVSSEEHQAIKIEGVVRTSVVAALNGSMTIDQPSAEELGIRKMLKEMADDLVIIHDKIGIIGHLHLPAKMPLAITDLSVPMAVFVYPAVSAIYLHELGKIQHLLKHYNGFC